MRNLDRATRKKMRSHFIYLVLLYTNVVITFGLVYAIFDLLNIGPIVDHYSTVEHQDSLYDRLTTSLYFSIITLFSVGYGDVTPFGLSRAVAMIQAMLGYILPAVIVIQYMNTNEK